MWMNAKPCSCKPIRCGQMWVFLCSMIVCMLLLWFFLRPLIVLSVLFCHKKQCTLVLLWDSDGKCIVVAELCNADADAGGTTLCEEVWRHVSTSFADSRCRMSISNKHNLHCWDSAALPNKLCRFKTLRCVFTFIPMFAQFCTCTVLSFQFISSLIDFCNSSIARQTSVSSKETLIASFQTCQSNPQEITPFSNRPMLVASCYNLQHRWSQARYSTSVSCNGPVQNTVSCCTAWLFKKDFNGLCLESPTIHSNWRKLMKISTW